MIKTQSLDNATYAIGYSVYKMLKWIILPQSFCLDLGLLQPPRKECHQHDRFYLFDGETLRCEQLEECKIELESNTRKAYFKSWVNCKPAECWEECNLGARKCQSKKLSRDAANTKVEFIANHMGSILMYLAAKGEWRNSYFKKAKAFKYKTFSHKIFHLLSIGVLIALQRTRQKPPSAPGSSALVASTQWSA